MRSYVDLCLFIRFIELSRRRLGQDYPPGKDPVAVLQLWQDHEAAMPSYVFHEIYHFWQGLRLPFVHRYARRTLDGLPVTLRWLVEHEVDLRAVDESSDIESANRAAIWKTTGLQHVPKRYRILAPLDLLEGAATLAEYQMQNDEAARVDGLVFDRWSKRNPSYTSALTLLRERLDDDGFALRVFLPLVCQSFATSDPARAFGQLVELARRCKPTQAELTPAPPTTWTELARALLRHLPFDAEPDSEEGYCRLLPAQMYRTPQHPIGGQLAREWEDRCLAGDGDYDKVLEMPGWISDEVLHDCRDRYGPPFTVVRFQLQDGSRAVQIYAAENARTGVFDEHEIPALLTTYGLLRRRTGLHFDTGTRLCHHEQCTYYAANWCNTFTFVPRHADDCTFPGYVHSMMDLVRKSSLMNR